MRHGTVGSRASGRTSNYLKPDEPKHHTDHWTLGKSGDILSLLPGFELPSLQSLAQGYKWDFFTDPSRVHCKQGWRKTVLARPYLNWKPTGLGLQSTQPMQQCLKLKVHFCVADLIKAIISFVDELCLCHWLLDLGKIFFYHAFSL